MYEICVEESNFIPHNKCFSNCSGSVDLPVVVRIKEIEPADSGRLSVEGLMYSLPPTQKVQSRRIFKKMVFFWGKQLRK